MAELEKISVIPTNTMGISTSEGLPFMIPCSWSQWRVSECQNTFVLFQQASSE